MMKISWLVLVVNLVVRALNTIYFKNVSLSLNDANQSCYESYIDIRELKCSDDSIGATGTVRHYTLRSIYQRVYICFGEMDGARRNTGFKFSVSCNDRNNSQFILSLLSNRLAIEMNNLQSNKTIRNHASSNFELKNNKIPLNSNDIPSPFGSSFYTTVGETGAIELVSDRVSLPALGETVSNIELTTVLPKIIADYYCDVSRLLLDRNGTATRRKKCPSVMVAGHDEYVKLLVRLYRLNMLTFTSTPMCINGAFGVPKDETAIRLIIDATNCNNMMVVPPPVQLPNASHLANVSSTSSFYITKLDLSNYYHQIQLPVSLRPYFCLPSINQSDLSSFSLDSTTSSIKSVRMYPMLTTLPMGWSHSVFIAQSVHEHVLYTMNVALNPLNNVLVQSTLVSSLHLIYIDDMAILAYDQIVMNELVNKVKISYESVGLKINVKKCVSPTMELVKVIGVSICGRTQRISVATSDLVSLIYRTITLLDQLECTSHQLSIIVGHWTWYLLLKRSMLSILRCTYRFITIFSNTDETKLIWTSIRRELLLVSSLAPLIQVEMNIKLCNRVIATDASMYGYGVMSNNQYSSSSQHSITLSTLAGHVGLHASSCAAISFDTACDVTNTIDRLTLLDTVHQPIISLTMMNRMRNDIEIASLVRSVRESVSWITIMSGRWRYNDDSTHINELELQSVLLAVRWLSTLLITRTRNRKVIMLVDNSVSIYSLRKGRSSSVELLSIIRRISMLLLSMDVVLKIVYVPSGMNPADAASRLNTSYQ